MALGGTTRKELVGLSVELEVVTRDKLRKFLFTLTKTKEGDADNWGIDFELLDRKTAAGAFERVLSLEVDLDLRKVAVEDVEATADKGLNKAQVEFALTTVAADAQKLNDGKIKESRMARTVRDLIAARNE
jgi:hypothetical protein